MIHAQRPAAIRIRLIADITPDGTDAPQELRRAYVGIELGAWEVQQRGRPMFAVSMVDLGDALLVRAPDIGGEFVEAAKPIIDHARDQGGFATVLVRPSCCTVLGTAQ
jgi:hypothetical protein